MIHAFSRTRAAMVLMAVATACGEEPLTIDGASPSSGAVVQASVSGSPGDRAAMQQIVDTFDEAWTSGDAVTYAAQYAGAEWINPSGTILTDPAAIKAVYTFILDGFAAGTTRQSHIRSLTFLTGTIAVLNIDARVTGFTTLPPGVVEWQPGVLRALEKNILLKRAGEWRIIEHQQLLVAPGN